MLAETAGRIMALLNEMPEVKKCCLYGSLAEGKSDELSDIDINIDVSGYDNGKFMLVLAERLGKQIPVFYSDYAPSLVPEKYIVSLAVDEDRPTLVVDLCCCAQPHCSSVTAQQVRALNDTFSHMLKLWTANWKHYVRGKNCRSDILRMAGKIGISGAEAKPEGELLEETLQWLEAHAPEKLEKFIKSCRREYEKRAVPQ